MDGTAPASALPTGRIQGTSTVTAAAAMAAIMGMPGTPAIAMRAAEGAQ